MSANAPKNLIRLPEGFTQPAHLTARFEQALFLIEQDQIPTILVKFTQHNAQRHK